MKQLGNVENESCKLNRKIKWMINSPGASFQLFNCESHSPTRVRITSNDLDTSDKISFAANCTSVFGTRVRPIFVSKGAFGLESIKKKPDGVTVHPHGNFVPGTSLYVSVVGAAGLARRGLLGESEPCVVPEVLELEGWTCGAVRRPKQKQLAPSSPTCGASRLGEACGLFLRSAPLLEVCSASRVGPV